ncbi:hypothetical protein JTE90_011206 [Oedothorax gibbosus]|uniref:Uncharacterized protein n=1 Tax=Oedothorax gibbosus TaxID=931172 RepID=A0AAV6VZJ7_9ARAC|nr:hypothetical protein JTE90_011206 [Oedothorax gibbosus]
MLRHSSQPVSKCDIEFFEVESSTDHDVIGHKSKAGLYQTIKRRKKNILLWKSSAAVTATVIDVAETRGKVAIWRVASGQRLTPEPSTWATVQIPHVPFSDESVCLTCVASYLCGSSLCPTGGHLSFGTRGLLI